MGLAGKNLLQGPRLPLALWLFQMVFPALGLIPVLTRLANEQPLGIYSFTLLGLTLSWWAGCLLALASGRIRGWIRTHGPQLLTLYVSTTVGLVSLEAFCRYEVAHSRESWRKVHALVEFSPELGWKLVPGKDGIGAHGWRGPYRATAKPKGCYRIVCVGDSSTYGSSCSWDETWPHHLETILNSDTSWTAAHGTTEVVNLGVPAFGTDQELLALKKYGMAFQPDVVILHVCINDFADVSFDHDWRIWEGVTRYRPYFALESGQLVLKQDHAPPPRAPAGQPDEHHGMGLESALLYKVGRFLANRENRFVGGAKNLWPIHDAFHAEYARARPLVWALVRDMARTVDGAGCTFLVTLSPTSMDGPADAPPLRVASFVREYQADAAAAGVTAINCIAEYFAAGGNARFRAAGDIGHLNGQGNAFVARHTLRWLQDHVAAR